MAQKQNLYGESGKAYEFLVYALDTNFKAAGGVYVFAALGGNKWTIIYVGQTDNLKRRLNEQLEQHHRIDCIRREKATHILVRLVSGDQARLDVETDLRRKYDPACNRQ